VDQKFKNRKFLVLSPWLRKINKTKPPKIRIISETPAVFEKIDFVYFL